MGITRKIIGWCDKKFAEALAEGNDKKAFSSGFVEGLVDGAVLMYVPVTIACYIWMKKALDK